MKKILITLLAVMVALTSIITVSACGKGKDFSDQEYEFYVPDGAPALAIGSLIAENNQLDRKVNYHVVTADTIGQNIKLNGDLGILPVNASSKLFGSGEEFQMLGVVTHGNLFILTKTQISGVTDLVGKVVAVAGQGNFMDLTLRLILKNNDIEYVTSNAVVEGKVAIRYFGAASEIIPALKQNKIDTALLPEPAATTAQSKVGGLFVTDLQQVYGGGYPQAVLVARKTMIEDKAFINAVIDAITENGNYLANAQNVELAVNAINANVTAQGREANLVVAQMSANVITNLNIRFEKAKLQKEKVKAYIEGLRGIDSDAVGVLNDAFFYGA